MSKSVGNYKKHSLRDIVQRFLKISRRHTSIEVVDDRGLRFKKKKKKKERKRIDLDREGGREGENGEN